MYNRINHFFLFSFIEFFCCFCINKPTTPLKRRILNEPCNQFSLLNFKTFLLKPFLYVSELFGVEKTIQWVRLKIEVFRLIAGITGRNCRFSDQHINNRLPYTSILKYSSQFLFFFSGDHLNKRQTNRDTDDVLH